MMQKLTNSYEVWRTLRVYVKEGRYRYEVTDFGGRDIGNAYDPQIYRVEPTNPMNVRRYGAEVAKQGAGRHCLPVGRHEHAHGRSNRLVTETPPIVVDKVLGVD